MGGVSVCQPSMPLQLQDQVGLPPAYNANLNNWNDVIHGMITLPRRPYFAMFRAWQDKWQCLWPFVIDVILPTTWGVEFKINLYPVQSLIELRHPNKWNNPREDRSFMNGLGPIKKQLFIVPARVWFSFRIRIFICHQNMLKSNFSEFRNMRSASLWLSIGTSMMASVAWCSSWIGLQTFIFEYFVRPHKKLFIAHLYMVW